ncbi:MAG: hypothetical protein ACYCXT_10985 [Acidiferrobacteraceae bacterium]
MDGHKSDLEAVEGAFGADIEHAMLVKRRGENKNQGPERTCGPASALEHAARRSRVNRQWRPSAHSYVERQKLTMRVSMRRFTRLTHGFLRRLENLEGGIGRIYPLLRIIPAMAAEVSDHVWSLEEITALTYAHSN